MIETNECDSSETENDHRKFDGNLETMETIWANPVLLVCQTLTLMPPMKFRILVNIHLNLFILFHLHVGLLSNKITLLVHTPGLFFSNGKIGCRECRNVNTLGLHAKQRSHISKEWIECTVFYAKRRVVKYQQHKSTCEKKSPGMQKVMHT